MSGRPRWLAPAIAVGAAVALIAVLVATAGGEPDRSAGAPADGAAPGSIATTTRATKGASAATTRRARRTLKVAFTGDTLIHSVVYNQARTNGARSGVAYDFNPMFDKVRPILSGADLAICHQETPVTADNKQVSGFPVFSTPHEIVAALKGAGYDGCSTASNHSLDRAVAGVNDTVGAFEQNGLQQSGMARTPDEASKPALYTVNGVTVAHLAYSYGLNGIPLPADKPWLVRLINRGRESPPDQAYTSQFVLADARAARAAGAEIVIVSLQWGAEYQSKPTPAQTALAAELVASPDIDLVVGHHVHVIQPIDKIGDKYVVYGVGNFLSNQSPAAAPELPAGSQDGVIVEATFAESDTDGAFSVTKLSYTPTWVDRGNGFVITPVAATLRDPATPAPLRNALTDSLARTNAAINGLGAVEKHGVAIAG